MKPKDTILWFVSNGKRSSIIVAFLGSYALLGLLFGIVYWRAGMTSTSSIIDNVYFSFTTQIGLGVAQIHPVTIYGKVLSLVQFSIGVLWIAFIPSIIIVRIASPAKGVFRVDKYIVFYPKARCFRFRYANTSKLNAIDLRFDIRARFVVDDQDYNIRNLKIELNNPTPPDARSMIPFFLRTKVLDDHQVQQINGSRNYSLVLHPGHIRGNVSIVMRVACSYFMGTFEKTETFTYGNIVCGTFIPIQADRNDPLEWGNIDQHMLVEDMEGGEHFCKHQCSFRQECRIGNKVL